MGGLEMGSMGLEMGSVGWEMGSMGLEMGLEMGLMGRGELYMAL